MWYTTCEVICLARDYQLPHYVQALVRFDVEGHMAPVEIIWDDGTRYEIDRVLSVDRRAFSGAGGSTLRFTVRIQGRQRYLWWEYESTHRWFVGVGPG